MVHSESHGHDHGHGHGHGDGDGDGHSHSGMFILATLIKVCDGSLSGVAARVKML